MRSDSSRKLIRDELTPYLRDLEHFPRLSNAEVNQLAQASLAGDLRARDLLISHNLRLAFKVANWFLGRGPALEDLIQDGSLGLIKAAEKFDPSNGAPFGAYARYWIRASIEKAIYKDSQIRIPEYLFPVIRRVRLELENSEAQSRKQFTHKELAQKLSLPVLRVKKALFVLNGSVSQKIYSLDDPTPELGNENGRWEVIRDYRTLTPEEFLEAKDEIAVARKRLLCLLDEFSVFPDRDQILFRRFYGLNRSWKSRSDKQLAERFSISRFRVYEIIRRIWDELGMSYMSGDRWLRGEVQRIQMLEEIVAIYESEEEEDMRDFFSEEVMSRTKQRVGVTLSLKDLERVDYLLRIARAADIPKASRSFVVRSLVRDSLNNLKDKTPAEIARYFREILKSELGENSSEIVPAQAS